MENMNDDFVIFWQQKYNSIIVIESLKEDERHTGKELHDDIIHRLCSKNNLTSCYKNPTTIDDFKTVMQNLINAVKTKGWIPILHIEMHGNEDGLQLENGDLIAWEEVVSYFREINVFLNNQLLVTLATCKGAYMQKAILLEMPTPVMCLIASAEVIHNDKLIQDFAGLYEGLLNGDSPQSWINSVNLQHNKYLYKILHCQVIFQIAVEVGISSGIPSQRLDNIRKIFLMES